MSGDVLMTPAYDHPMPTEDARVLLEAARALVEQARRSCWFTVESTDNYDTRRVICDGRNALRQAEMGLCVALEQFDCLELVTISDIERSVRLKKGVI